MPITSVAGSITPRSRSRAGAAAETPPSPRRIHDAWRGFWGRGRGSNRQSRGELRKELDYWLQPGTDDAHCVICQRRSGATLRWLQTLPAGDDESIEAEWSYCPRHSRLLLADLEVRAHLWERLPGALAHARRDLITHPDHLAGPLPCPPCKIENQAETAAIHAAAVAPALGTSTVPGLNYLPLCHEHAVRVADRIVGHLGPEPRAISELHALLAGHRRQLRHLADRLPQLPAAELVAQADEDAPRRAVHQAGVVRGPSRTMLSADASATPTGRDSTVPAGASERQTMGCTICTQAADTTRAFLSDMVARVRGVGRHDRPITLCSAHTHDLLAVGDLDSPAAVDAVLQAAARADLHRLAPVLDWLDSGFAQPHTIRAAVAELAAPRPCPACGIYREADRHAAATFAAAGPDLPADPSEPICYRHAATVPADHPSRDCLLDALRNAAHDVRHRPATQRATADTGAVATATTTTTTTTTTTIAINTTGKVDVTALALLDGRIPTDIAGAEDDA